MCRKIEIDITAAGHIHVHPTDCPDEGTTCRDHSAPYRELGRVISDVDLGNSHVAIVACVITDLAALADAAESLGLELVLGQTRYKWYGKSVGDYRAADRVEAAGITPDGRCLHAIRIPNNSKAYEIGVVANPDGPGFRLVWDHYRGGFGLSRHISRRPEGRDMELLTQSYAVAAARRVAAVRRDRIISHVVQADGCIKITAAVAV